MGVIVENGGVLTTVQDIGRFGYEQYGLSTTLMPVKSLLYE